MFKNWKTTLFGLVAGVFNLFANGASWKQVVFSAAVAGLGLLSKDLNVTGGTVGQPTSPQAEAQSAVAH